MENGNIALTEAEWEVMQCLWDRSPMTGREVTENLHTRMGWSRSTSLTLLRRLEAKGAVVGNTDSDVKLFRPLIGKDEVAVRETQSLLNRAYQGSLSLLVSAFTKDQTLSQKEIDELYSILREMEER
jgi:BlaI family penicillinase repressor